MKTRLLILSTLFALPAFAQDRMAQTLVEYCNTATYSVQHEVKIGEVVGLGHHRNGYLLISQPTDDINIRMYLLSLSAELGLPHKCMEYLNGQQLLTIDQDGLPPSLLARIYFDFNRATLTPASKTILSRVADTLRRSPRMVLLEGNTDSIGSEAYNYRLGLQRAQSTGIYLVKEAGEMIQFTVNSQGETKPIASNQTQAGRQLNRRVDIYPK